MAATDGIHVVDVGEGPVVVVPRLNVDWLAHDLAPLTDRFRVLVVAPRGFGPADRPEALDRASTVVTDLAAVLDELEVAHCTAFGYSMNGVAAALLARTDARVRAVACGGFPLTADLSGMGERARARHAAVRTDPALCARHVATHSPEAVESFWSDVAALPRGTLADLPCPLHVWWGDADAVLASLRDPDDLCRDLEDRSIGHTVLPGLDHDGMLGRLDRWLPDVAAWLATEA